MRVMCMILSGLLLQSCYRPESVFKSDEAKLRLFLKGSGPDRVRTLHLEVAQIELLVKKDGQLKGVITGRNLKTVNFQRLIAGESLPAGNVGLEEGSIVQEIRLVLNEANNYLEWENGRRCSLIVRPEARDALTIQVDDNSPLQGGNEYSLSLAISAEATPLMDGSELCLLKPGLSRGGMARLHSSDQDWGADEIVSLSQIEKI